MSIATSLLRSIPQATTAALLYVGLAFPVHSAETVYPPATSFLYGNSSVNEMGQESFVKGTGGLNYRYLVPKHYDSTVKYPVIIFLHGIGEAGNDNLKQMNAGNGTANGALALVSTAHPDNQEDHPCFLVIPQSPSGWWGAGNVPDLLNIVHTLNQYYSIDMDRICLTGLSGGGMGAWNILCSEAASNFSCGVLLSARAEGNINAFPRNFPVWAFHAADDATIGCGGSEDAIAMLRERGQPAIFTRYNTGGHGRATWTAAYRTPLLLPWMLAQQRGRPMQGVFNLNITSATQGAKLNLTGTADPAPGFTRVGWSSASVKPGPTLPDPVIDGNRITSSASNFDSSYVGYRVALSYHLKFYDALEYFDVVAVPSEHILELNAAPKPESKTCRLFPPGTYHVNSFAGTGTSPTWTLSNIPLSAGTNVIQVIGEAPSWSDGNGGLTTVNATYMIDYTSHSGDTTAPTIVINKPSTEPTYETSDTTIDLSGTASDDAPVAQVTWTSNFGGSGTADGTSNWAMGKVALSPGINTITVRATDTSANVSAAMIYINCTAPPPPLPEKASSPPN